MMGVTMDKPGWYVVNWGDNSFDPQIVLVSGRLTPGLQMLATGNGDFLSPVVKEVLAGPFTPEEVVRMEARLGVAQGTINGLGRVLEARNKTVAELEARLKEVEKERDKLQEVFEKVTEHWCQLVLDTQGCVEAGKPKAVKAE